MLNIYIWPIDRTLSGATTLDQSEPGSDGNDGVLRIPQSSSITGASPLDCLMSYPGLYLGESYTFAEMQSMYSIAPADRARLFNAKSCLHTHTDTHTHIVESDWLIYCFYFSHLS